MITPQLRHQKCKSRRGSVGWSPPKGLSQRQFLAGGWCTSLFLKGFSATWDWGAFQESAGVDTVASHPKFGGLGFPGGSAGRAAFGCARVVGRLSCKRCLPHCMGGESALLLLICVWAGVAVGPQTGERFWELLRDLWRAVALLMAPWCAEEDVPTSANLNYFGSSGSCVRWQRDDEALFGGQEESKLIVSVSIRFSALFRWKPRPSPDYEADSTWLHHGDLLVMDGRCQDEYLHSTDPRLQGERANITSQWPKNHLPQCPVGAGVMCCLPTCVRESPVSASAGVGWPILCFLAFLLVILGWGLLTLALLMLVRFWQQKDAEFWFSPLGLIRNQHSVCCSAWEVL